MNENSQGKQPVAGKEDRQRQGGNTLGQPHSELGWFGSWLGNRYCAWYRYGVAVLAVLAALLIDAGDFLSGNYRIYLIFYPFIAIAALQGGVGPGLLAIALSCLSVATFWLEPVGDPAIAARADRLSMLMFILGNLFLVGICECLRRAILKAAEAEAHRKSSAELRQIIDLVPHFIFCKDWNGNILLANKAQADAYNTTVEELTGQPQAKFQKVESELHRFLQQDREVMETGQTKFIPEETFVDSSGNLRFLQTTKIPYKGSGVEIRGALGVAIDITERKRAEEALRKNEAFLRVISETTPDHIFIKDREGRYITANPAVLGMLGKSFEEVIGKRDDELLPNAETWRSIMENDQRVIRSGVTEVFEESIPTSSGRRIFLTTKSPYLDDNGRITGIIGVAADITDRKRNEEELRKTKEAAEAANQTKDRFLAILSHELRTPLTPALLTVSIYEKDIELPLECRENLRAVRQNLKLEARLIDDLLDLNRLVHGKIALHTHIRDLHQKLQNVLNICRAEIEAKGLVVRMELTATEHNVNGDDGRLQQVFWNLLKNAAKFTPSRGSIIIRTSNPHAGFVRVEVSDSGIGIKPEIIPRLFVAFEQGEADAQRIYGGLGLGLTICKALVDLHGGNIWASSKGPGNGATFTVELPVTSSPIIAENGPPPAVPETGKIPKGKHAPKILLVEDNKDTLRILGRILERSGYKVVSAENKAAALDAAKASRESSEKFDFVISDLGLPDGNGRDLMRELRDRDGLSGIAISGYGMEEDIKESLKAGFIGHLTKPIEIEELQKAISDLIGH